MGVFVIKLNKTESKQIKLIQPYTEYSKEFPQNILFKK